MISSSRREGGGDFELSLSIYIGREWKGGFALMIPGFRKVMLECISTVGSNISTEIIIIHLAKSISF